MTEARNSEEELFPVSLSFPGAGSGLLTYTCIGPSMFPTIKPGDVIVVYPYGALPVRRGDVIVFRLPGGERVISHRVVKVRGNRLTVRGDNNSLEDPWGLSREDVVGLVTRRERRGRTRSLAGGPAGALLGGISRAAAMARLTLFRFFRPAYLWAAKNGVFWRVLPFRLKTKLVAVRRPWGQELQLVAGRLVIARRPAGMRQWMIRRPFKLLIHPKFLP